MRLLFITNEFPNPYHPNKGTFNLSLARALAAEHEIRVISPISYIDEWRAVRRGQRMMSGARRSVIEGIEVHYPRYVYPPKVMRSRYGWFFWRSMRKTVWRMLGDFVPDAVVSYWVHPDGEAGLRVSRATGAPSAVLVGGSDVLLLPRNPARRRRVVNVLKRTDATLTVSRDLKAKVEELGIDPEKVHVWRQGVDATLFHPGDRGEARKRLGMEPEGPVILWVGRMERVKALSILMGACQNLNERGVSFSLHLVGDGSLRKSLEQEVAARKLQPRVKFEGSWPQDRLGEWYRSANVTVLPSWSEGLPNVLRESAACGTPFVASRVGGIAEIADEKTDRLVPPGDECALADALEQSLAQSSSPMASSARSADWQESARQLISLLHPLVEAARNEDQPWWISPRRFRAEPSKPSWIRQAAQAILSGAMPRRMFVRRGSRACGAACLTFDDGPHPVHTPRLLDVLAREKVHGTFFVIGRQAERHPELVRRIVDEGHALGNHSYYHCDPRLMTSSELVAGARRVSGVLEEMTQHKVMLYRPPWGRIRARDMAMLWRTGHTVALWNVDPRDYQRDTARDVAACFDEKPLRSGDVVLMHDRLPLAAQALPQVIAEARDRGLRFETLEQWVQ